MQQFPSISIIGTGNVAELLGQRLLKAGCILSSVIGRNQRRLVQLSSDWKCNIESIDAISGDIVLVAVSDDVTIEIIEQIEQNKIVFYTAGTIDINLIKHPQVGVFYPLQTVTKSRILKIDSFPILIESEHPEVIKKLNLIAQLISNQVSVCDSIERKKIHCIAVFINNFSNHVIHIGQSLATKEKIDFSLFSSLLKETFEKLNEMNAKDAQTGPARRNDLETISNHLNFLTESEKSIYLTITNSILTTYNHDKL